MSERSIGGPVGQRTQPTPSELERRRIEKMNTSATLGRLLQPWLLRAIAFAVILAAPILLIEVLAFFLGSQRVLSFLPSIDLRQYLSLAFVPAAFLALGLNVAKEYERAVVLFLGRSRFWTSRGPGVYYVLPIFESIEEIQDLRIRKKHITAAQSQTKDQVAVDAEAELFYRISPIRSERASLEVRDFDGATQGAAEAELKQRIGMNELDEVITRREAVSEDALKHLNEFVSKWGAEVTGLMFTDVRPDEDAADEIRTAAVARYSARARFEASAMEKSIAENNKIAAEIYREDPIAFQIRQINAFTEAMEKPGVSTVVVPSGAAEALGRFFGLSQGAEASSQGSSE